METFIRKLTNNELFLAAAGILLLYVLYLLKDILMILFISFILVVALHPIVRLFQRLKLPAAVATLLTILMTASILGGLFFLIYYGLSKQVDVLSLSISDAINDLPLSETFRVNFSIREIFSQLFAPRDRIFTFVTYTLVGLVASLLTVLVIAVYWLSDYDHVKSYILSRFKKKKRAEMMYHTVERRLGGWVRGQLLISLVIGITTYIAYLIIGLPAARALAIIAALLEIIPTLGPILAAIPAILIALTISPHVAVITLLANIGIQQLETHLVAPKILQYTVKLHPIAIIVVLYAGSQLAGLMGVLLAVPVTLLIASLHDGYNQTTAAAAKS